MGRIPVGRRWLAAITGLAVAFAGLLAGSPDTAAAPDGSPFTIVVKASPHAVYESREAIPDGDWRGAWDIALTSAAAAPSLAYTDTYVEVRHGQAVSLYRMREDGVLIEEGSGRAIALPASIRWQWRAAANRLRERHYGELIGWDIARERVPLKSSFTVIDLETGLSFRVQRRAGRHHADVQPLTRQDTAVMKRIYGGAWSWKRRAIVVMAEGRPIAASMHGMPHGGDGIPGNGFSGHFCIHFLGSATHRSSHADLAHQLMVYKAAGRLNEFVRSLPPDKQAEAFFESIRQQDEALLAAVLRGTAPRTFAKFHGWLNEVETVRPDPTKRPALFDDEVYAEWQAKATVHRRNAKPRNETFRFVFVRETTGSPWVMTEIDG